MAIAFVNETHGYIDNTSPGTSLPATAANHSAGNLLVAIVAQSINTIYVTSITDTAGNTYTKVVEKQGSSNSRVEIWYARDIHGNANNIITAHFSDIAYYREISVLQYSGIGQTSPLDVYNTGIGASTSQLTGSSTTTFADEIIVAGYWEFGTTGTFTAGTNFTLRYGGVFLGTEDRIISSTGSYNSTMTYDTGYGYVAVHATFIIAGAIPSASISPSISPSLSPSISASISASVSPSISPSVSPSISPTPGPPGYEGAFFLMFS